MNRMSLYESGDSSGEISLRDLCNYKFQSKILEEVSLEKVAYWITRGGWPGNIDVEDSECYELATWKMLLKLT